MESIHELLAKRYLRGVAGDMCSGEQKIRGNTYLRYNGIIMIIVENNRQIS